MDRVVVFLVLACLLLTASTVLGGDRQTEATPAPVINSAATGGLTYLGPQPEPPDKPAEDELNSFALIVLWLFGFDR